MLADKKIEVESQVKTQETTKVEATQTGDITQNITSNTEVKSKDGQIPLDKPGMAQNGAGNNVAGTNQPADDQSANNLGTTGDATPKNIDDQTGNQAQPADEVNKPVGETPENIDGQAGGTPAGMATGTAGLGDQAKQAPDGGKLSNITPSVKGDEGNVDLGKSADKGPMAKKDLQDKAKEGLKEKGGDAVKNAEKQGAKQMAKQAGQAIARFAAGAFVKVASLFSWPVVAGIIAILLIIILIFGALACSAANGYFGQSTNQKAGKDDANVKQLIEASKVEVNKTKKLTLNKRDQEFLESGEIDKRLAAALNYLVQKHTHISVSHIVSSYEDMKVNPESGNFHDVQIASNISAHKRGLAADIDEIDFVKDKCKCGQDIPVKVAWQIIGEKPSGTPTPDALKDIQSAQDLAKDAIKKSLEQIGVKGLDQPDIAAKLQTIAGLSSIYDLTKPEVVAALNAIGVTGIDNADFQAGIKRLQAMQNLYDLSPDDVNILMSGAGADLMGQIGVNITPEIKDSIATYQQAQILQSINSIDDLNNPEVQAALLKVGIDPNNADFRSSLEKITAVSNLTNGTYAFGTDAYNKSMATLGVTQNADMAAAFNYYQAFKNGFLNNNGQIISEAGFLSNLEKSGIIIEGTDGQKILKQYQAFSQIANWDGSVAPALKQAAFTAIGVNLTEQNKEFFQKYEAAQYLFYGGGSADDPQFQAALTTMGLDGSKIGAFKGEVDFWTAVAKNTNLQTVFPAEAAKMTQLQTILGVKDISDLGNPAVQQALSDFGINIKGEYDQIAGLSNVLQLVKGIETKDLANAAVQAAASQLKLSPEMVKNFGYVGDIQTLAQIKSPFDLANPQVQKSLSNLGIDIGNESIKTAMGQAGDINALINIKSPMDLLKPNTLKALSNLNIIKVDSQMMGQIGAVQTLLQIKSAKDLFNVNSIMALNTLGIISLANPVVAALTAISMISSLLGYDFFGFGNCKGNTNCYASSAQGNVHTVIGELLQMPYDLKDPEYYRVIQLITYSQERDVTPFAEQLDKLYGTNRPKNIGLFSMPESTGNIHIGY